MGGLEGKVVVISGAGSGVGRAAAWRLAGEGASVVLVGRTGQNLKETAAKLDSGRVLVYPCDISKPDEVEALAAAAFERFKQVNILVNSAGTNVPKRALEEVSVEDFQKIVDINLNGAFLFVRAFLPELRNQGGGTIINVGSVAGLQGSRVSGAAYVASKFGMRGLTQSINVEEQAHGIRACCISPGEINTPLLDRRPKPPPPEARGGFLQPEDLADCIALVALLPSRAVVEEIVIRPLARNQ